MGWFDEQIRLRKVNDEELLSDAFMDMAGAVMGKALQASLESNRVKTKNAIDAILSSLHLRSREIPDDVTELSDQLDYLLDPLGVMRRTVYLPSGWYKDAAGPMLLVMKESGTPVAALPSAPFGYEYTDPETLKKVRIGKSNEGLFEEEGLCFYKPFPQKKLGLRDLLMYMALSRSVSDHAMVLISSAVVTAVGAIMPMLQKLAYGKVLSSGQMTTLYALAFFMVSAAIGNILFSSVANMITQSVQTKQSVSIEAAVMMRILSLPASFFRKFSAGELYNRTQSVITLCKQLASVILGTGLTSAFSLVYILQVFHYTPALVIPALTITLATVVFSIASTLIQTRIAKAKLELSAQESGMNYAMITGIQKIKLAGAEKRAFARWGRLYAKEAEYQYNPPLVIKLNTVISMAINMIGVVVMYSAAIASGVTFDNYVAFTAAYGYISGAFMELSSIALMIAGIKPTLDMVKPILEEEPETDSGKQIVTRLGGSIELNHVYFRYTDNMPDILDDLSIKIKAGEYVAVVGETGCGKSTLVRLLLGFEKPRKGAVFYDGKDLSGLDLRSLRRHIGVVMQNGKLLMGSIFENITISAPWLGLQDAWDAAEAAGFADDIREMPMGMQTMISEGQGGISGGQKQRLLIARAIVGKPKILIFDEATSALDNITQRKVTEALNSYKCTRIVIAHRLSTIQACDRILVLRNGKIIEDGTYDELTAQNGFFAELVERQRLDLGEVPVPAEGETDNGALG
ncbi:MAG TPA: NHLP bacteriocin export ABC transporter permease/ATPase subunit [Lachnospiraceae bacterium]|nr:NHLP bacteriocin export ABC transporter permease/ATPase subunit [Lachnospiraceae bacterium]